MTGGLYLPLITRAKDKLRDAESIIERLINDPLPYQESPTRGAIKFLDLLYEIDRCNRKGRELVIPGEALYTQRAKRYIREHLREPICQSKVAEHLSITPEYLCAVFKKTEGISLIRYVNTAKLSAICSLIEKEHMKLCEAAALFGYSDPNYVSRLFKKYYGYNITDKQRTRQDTQ
jgi:AraC-like DNA-binding protein